MAGRQAGLPAVERPPGSPGVLRVCAFCMMSCESKCALRSKQSEERRIFFPKPRKVKAVSKKVFSEPKWLASFWPMAGRWRTLELETHQRRLGPRGPELDLRNCPAKSQIRGAVATAVARTSGRSDRFASDPEMDRLDGSHCTVH